MVTNTVQVLYRGFKEHRPPPAVLSPIPHELVRAWREKGGGREDLLFHHKFKFGYSTLQVYFLAIWKVCLVVYYTLTSCSPVFCCYRKSYWTLPHTTKTIRQAIQYYIYISHYTVLNCNSLLPGAILLHATRNMKTAIQCYTNKCHYTASDYIIYWQFQVKSNSATLSCVSDILL
jgi:hypothetical protein